MMLLRHLILIGIIFLPLVSGSLALGAAQTPPDFDLLSALSRVPLGEWRSISFTDFTSSMRDVNETWPPEPLSELTAGQQTVWAGVWQPELLSQDLETVGFEAFRLERVVEARTENEFMLWIEGQFELTRIVEALQLLGYESLTTLSAETYHATAEDKWRELMPYVSLPDGHTMLIASSEENLLALLNVYDGHDAAILKDDRLLQLLGRLPPLMTSGILRLTQPGEGCPLETGRFILHGLRYDLDTQNWQYVIEIGFPSGTLVSNVGDLADNLEFSTNPVSPYPGVFGQNTHLMDYELHESGVGNILQFVMDLRPGMQYLPFEAARQANNCLLFSAPPAAASTLALEYIPDLSAGRVNVSIQYGNAEQALYNAQMDAPLLTDLSQFNETQRASLNSTWRTALAFETNFADWFGFPPENIHQTVELSVEHGEYVRVLWGDFTVADVEAAFNKTGYVAVEQYQGTRIFTLRQAPESGGFLLSSLTQTAAVPRDGVLVFTNQIPNMRLTLDIMNGTFRTSLVRAQDLVMMSRLLADATNVTLRRFANPLSGGLVCGLPPYKSEGFANVLRPDGWHFLYTLGFNFQLDSADVTADALALVLEGSDYPLQGPGSATFGELSSVQTVETIDDTNTTVIMIDLSVSGTDQQASFFGQDLAQATLPPCALGDVTQ